ncbi:T9SS type A sorting domain-containing protein [candidate division KSB1 bacterium]|nr:T9SS type A sorting domain-containing protein [candidate division KSB1 bacterium]
MKKWGIFWTVLLAAAIVFNLQPAFSLLCTSEDPSSPVGITPSEVAGNPALCAGGLRIDPPASGTYNLDAFGNTVTVTISSNDCGQVFSWSASGNIVMDHVIAKGGSAANDYDYTGLNPRPTSDGLLHSPVNPSGFYANLSHIDFCFHYRLTISKTAETSFTRTFDWTIEKGCNGPNPLTLSAGQIYNYPFSWTVSATYEDSDWKVEGVITIANNTPYSATISSMIDELDGITITDFGITIPFNLASGETRTISYSANLSGAVDGTNEVTVITSTPLVEGGKATKSYAFGAPTTLIDECITVSDDCETDVQVCNADLTDGSFTHNYTCPIGPYTACGNYTYTNTAGFVSNDRGITGSDNCVVSVNVPCTGCTLTPGYWKTHSSHGPAPYDDTWALLGESTIFFLSGQSYYQVLWTNPSGGNAYYILVHAYIAAELNFLNGADPTAAQAAFDAATGLFNTYTPAEVANMKGKTGKDTRDQFIALAKTLDKYNNGLIGPGHCDESGGGLSKQDPEIESPDIDATEEKSFIPERYDLAQNYPNPFNPSTTFSFDLPKEGEVTLTIYNLSGQKVATVVNGFFSAGRHHVNWQAEQNMASGMYFYRLQAAGYVSVRKMLLLE